MTAFFTPRALAFWAAAGCLAALLIAYFYMERYLLLAPCPLCILDRFAVAVMGVGFLFVGIFYRRAAPLMRAGWWLATAALAVGFIFASRHIWLQNRPVDEAASCLSDNAAAQGLVELVAKAFDAKADCGAILWEVAGLSIPEQVLIMFVGFTVLQLIIATGVFKK